jgi:hypothetical protein
MDDIETWTHFGEHRTGTSVEAATADWLAGRLSAVGYEARITNFDLTTVLDPSGTLTVGPLTAPAFPQWRPPAACLGQEMTGLLLKLAEARPGCVALADQPLAATAYWSGEALAQGRQARRRLGPGGRLR